MKHKQLTELLNDLGDRLYLSLKAQEGNCRATSLANLRQARKYLEQSGKYMTYNFLNNEFNYGWKTQYELRLYSYRYVRNQHLKRFNNKR